MKIKASLLLLLVYCFCSIASSAMAGQNEDRSLLDSRGRHGSGT